MTPCGLVLSVAWLIGLLLTAPSVTAQTSRSDSAKSYLERGGAWLKKGEIERAISDFDLAIATDRGLAAAWYNRGITLMNAGRLNEALASFNSAIELYPSDAQAHNNRGLTKLKLSDRTGAEADFRHALELEPGMKEAGENLRKLLGAVAP